MRISTKRHLSRRTFLRGAGVAVGLPLLDAMVPAWTALAQTSAAPKPRLGFLYLPHGAIMEQWTPTGEGRTFELSPILKPLAPFQKQLTIVSGLENKPAILPPVHALNPGTWLSCVSPRPGQEPHGGVTIDQIAASQIGQDTPLPSLEVATEGRGGGGACDRTYGCSYGGTISFRTPATPLPMEADPRKLFERLFGQGDTAQERKAVAKQYSSILDLVSREAADLQRTLDAPDRVRLGNYLESVREIERRVHKMEERDLTSLDLPDVPVGTTFDQRLTLMFDMLALAYQANLTRVFTFMMAGEGSNVTYNHIGVSDAFHPLSHHQNDKARKERLVRIQTYHSQAFAKFLAKLAAMPDGDGSMLDHAILLYGSNMSNSNAHDEFPLPTLVVGGGCGKVKGGQHLRYPDRTPLANLHLTLLDRAGVPVEKVGDSTQVFAEV
jgi:BMFP domain-containing protein YqiC